KLAAAMKARHYQPAGADSATRRWSGLSVKPGAAAILGAMRSKATTVAPALRLVVSQPAPASTTALVQGAIPDEWAAEFSLVMPDSLADPCPPDEEEEAARWAAYEAMGAA